MSLIDYIFPRECLKCGKVGEYLCFECKKTLIPHPELCPVCHRPQKGGAVCVLCKSEEKMVLEGIIVGFSYEKWLKKLILKLKFYHKKDIGTFLAERGALLVLTHEKLAGEIENGNVVVSYVPSHWWRRYMEKGYNQSELLARTLAQMLQVSCLSLAVKSRATVSQLTLGRKERLENLKGVFQAKHLDQVRHGSTILLVDDVTTTGATLNQLALSIKKERSDLKIRGLVLARHTGK